MPLQDSHKKIHLIIFIILEVNNSENKNEIIHYILLSIFENIFNKCFVPINNLKNDEDKEMSRKYYKNIDNPIKAFIVFGKNLNLFKNFAKE